MRRMRELIITLVAFAIPAVLFLTVGSVGLKKLYLGHSGALFSGFRNLASSATPGEFQNSPKLFESSCGTYERLPTAKTSNLENAAVVQEFRAAKTLLSHWMVSHRKQLTPDAEHYMARQLSELKLQLPPHAEQPDLQHRGVGVFISNSGTPTLLIGKGFGALAQEDPVRARFEMVRLVAQAWSPCQIRDHVDKDPWVATLHCLKIQEAEACTENSESDAGWGTSTTLAFSLTSPQCKIPAFADEKVRQCLAKISLFKARRTVAGAGQ